MATRCPNCYGDSGTLHIRGVLTDALISDDGAECVGDIEWNDDHKADCSCGWQGLVADLVDGEICNGDDCGVLVEPDDPYYATPCGTYCTGCMDKHAKDCEICAHEFELDGDEDTDEDECAFCGEEECIAHDCDEKSAFREQARNG